MSSALTLIPMAPHRHVARRRPGRHHPFVNSGCRRSTADLAGVGRNERGPAFASPDLLDGIGEGQVRRRTAHNPQDKRTFLWVAGVLSPCRQRPLPRPPGPGLYIFTGLSVPGNAACAAAPACPWRMRSTWLSARASRVPTC